MESSLLISILSIVIGGGVATIVTNFINHRRIVTEKHIAKAEEAFLLITEISNALQRIKNEIRLSGPNSSLPASERLEEICSNLESGHLGEIIDRVEIVLKFYFPNTASKAGVWLAYVQRIRVQYNLVLFASTHLYDSIDETESLIKKIEESLAKIEDETNKMFIEGSELKDHLAESVHRKNVAKSYNIASQLRRFAVFNYPK